MVLDIERKLLTNFYDDPLMETDNPEYTNKKLFFI